MTSSRNHKNLVVMLSMLDALGNAVTTYKGFVELWGEPELLLRAALDAL
ncbi:hypothetical protein ACPOL_6572 [Acidisarcina polymorpha]|uniref:Uncharacterized protein n=1 Tax=Acidisarcina polymorpha TaxID=2211140 RepID=A0A2Z5GA49_9BACT|nr:hypothetical protein ACPOL_6572 [Acidisarcina polymorpha]